MTRVLRHLALPFHTEPLLLVAIFAVLLQLAFDAGILGLPAALILGSWFLKYAFLLLDHAAQGRPGAPVLSVEAANPLGEMRPLLFGLGLGVLYLATAAVGAFASPGFVAALRVLGLLALPAIVATHAVTGSYAEALSPATAAGVVRRLGSGYLLVLCVAVACGWAGRLVVLQGAAGDGSSLAALLTIAVLMLLWLELFAVLGGVIHDRRVELGYEPEHSPEKRASRDARDRDRERNHFLDQVFAEHRGGGKANPWATIQARANQSADPQAEYTWIYHRVANWPTPALAERIARELLPRLLASRSSGEALGIARGRLQANEQFRTASSDTLLRLVELARDAGDRPLARALLRDFDRHYPGDPQVTRARRLAEDLVR